MTKRFRRYSTSLKVVLILFGAIGICYFAKLFTGKKQLMLADTVAENEPPKKHKRKHKVKKHLPENIVPASVDTLAQADRVMVIKPTVVKQAEVVLKPAPAKSQPDSSANNTYLYITYVQPNVTGIVKMRQQDSYYADIIADIPANAKVQVLKKGQMYYKVSYNNNIGFVPRWALHVK